MNIFKTAVQRPVATLMIFFGVLVLGIYSIMRIPIDLFPELNPPVINVVTAYPGGGPQEIEQNVTEPLEDQLSTVSNLDEITSSSVSDVSSIELEFNWSADMTEAANDTRDVISRVRNQLPEDAEDPFIFKFSSGDIPVVILGVTAEESFPNLRKTLDDELVSPLNRLPGVGNVSLQGGPEREIKVQIKPEKLEAYSSITMNTIAQALQAENTNIPAGNVDIGEMEFNIRANTKLDDISDIRDIVLSNEGNKPVYIKDVAEVKDGLKDRTQLARVNEQRGLTVLIQKQSNANTVKVADAVNKKLTEIKPELPNDVETATILNTSDDIKQSIGNLSQVLIYSRIFVVLVVLLFIRRWRATFIVALTIPFSLIAGFIYLSLTGQSLNLISLSSLSIALGMVVDDAIVVFENIMQRIEDGSRPREGAIYGTNEVGTAVLATTLTVIAVFLPLTLIPGMMGIWFSQLGWIVTITIAVSTIAALTLTPVLSSLMLDQGKDWKKQSNFGSKIYNFLETGLSGLEQGYKRFLSKTLNYKTVTVLIAILLFGGSFALVPMIGTSFMPENDQGSFQANLELQTGTNLQTTEKTIKQVEDLLNEKVPELKTMSITSGTSTEGFSALNAGESGPNIIEIRGSLIPASKRDRSVFEIVEMLRNEFYQIPAITQYTVKNSSMGQNEAPIAIDVISPNFEQNARMANKIAQTMDSIHGTRNVDISQNPARAEYHIDYDRERLATLGLNASTVANNVRGKIDGLTATQFRDEEGDEYDIEVQYAESERQSLKALRNIAIPTPGGDKLELSSLGRITQQYAPPNIKHVNRERAVTVTTDLHDASFNEVMPEMKSYINDELNLGRSVDIKYGGQYADQQDTFADMFLILGLSIILVFLVMAAQFESLKDPFVIMFSIPFAFTGVIGSLYITNTPLSAIAFLGGIILVGIVVKNAIVLVDYTKLLRNRGLPLYEAIAESGLSRLRPVLMTTLTTLLAMLPLALSQGEGSATWRPMAISVIGGLAFSTLVTLIFVPVMYAIFERNSEDKRSLLN